MTWSNRLRYTFDAPAFAKDVIGFDPDPVQHRLLATTPSRCILNGSRQWGKSTLTVIKAIHHAIFNGFLRKIEHFTRKAGFKPRGDGKNSSSLRLPNRSRIIGHPPNKDAIRGFAAPSFMLIDEAARVPDDLTKPFAPCLTPQPALDRPTRLGICYCPLTFEVLGLRPR